MPVNLLEIVLDSYVIEIGNYWPDQFIHVFEVLGSVDSDAHGSVSFFCASLDLPADNIWNDHEFRCITHPRPYRPFGVLMAKNINVVVKDNDALDDSAYRVEASMRFECGFDQLAWFVVALFMYLSVMSHSREATCNSSLCGSNKNGVVKNGTLGPTGFVNVDSRSK